MKCYYYHITELLYKIISHGTCKSHGLNMVKSKRQCESAAAHLGLKNRVAYDEQNPYRPHGCIYASNKWLIWQNPIGHPFPSAFCGSIYGDNDYNCICGPKGITQRILPYRFAQFFVFILQRIVL